MGTKAVRVFYRKSDNQIVWQYELRGPGEFPITVKDSLIEIPNKMPDGETQLGGEWQEYACIEELDSEKAVAFLASNENQIINDQLIIGTPRIIPEPIPPRDLEAELDENKAELDALKVQLKDKGII